MFVAGNVLQGVAVVLDGALEIYKWVLIISALISWVSPDPYNPIVQFLRRVTEPVLMPIRRWLGVRMFGRTMLDLSPLVAIFAIIFLQYALVGSLMDFARRLH